MEQLADAATSLSAPSGLEALVAPDGVRLTWTPTSHLGTAQLVERSNATTGEVATLATLDASATEYFDAAPAAGAYLYQVTVVAGPTHFGWVSSDPVQAFVPPPPGAWGLEQDMLRVPDADSVARTGDGAWWFARYWSNQPRPPMIGWDLSAWAPAAGGWEPHHLGAGRAGEFLVPPGLVLDTRGRPHVLWLHIVDAVPTSSPHMELRHTWMDEAVWNEEVIAERVFSSANPYLVQFALVGAGTLHVLWQSTEISGTTMLTSTEYATNAGGNWSVSPLSFGLLDPTAGACFWLSSAPDGTVHIVLLGQQASGERGVELLRRLPGGSWDEEAVPIGSISVQDSLDLRPLSRGADDLDLLYTRRTGGLLPAEYGFLARTAAGWDTPEALGEVNGGSTYALPGLAATLDGQRRAALLDLPDGLTLATLEAGTGWVTSRIHPSVRIGVPWLGFDARGALDILLPGDAVSADGFVERIHLHSTR